jgi:dihydroflavonol-4-reductase
MKVAITGGTGIVGGAILRHLLAEENEVRALVRQGRSLPANVEPVVGDVLDRDSLQRCFAGVDLIYHVAGVNKLCSRDLAAMFRTNVEGTRLVVGLAGNARLIHTSSAATLGEAEGEIGTEVTIPSGQWINAYAESKWLAENEVTAVAGRQEVVIVNPSSVQGPGRATGTGRILLALMAGRLRTLVETRISIVDIDDCARGHLLAATNGASGRRYVLNSFSMTMSEAVGLVERVIGRQLPVRWISPSVAKALGGIAGSIYRVIGKDAPICTESIRTILHGHVYDGTRATRELGLKYTSADDLFTRLFAWAKSEGKL